MFSSVLPGLIVPLVKPVGQATLLRLQQRAAAQTVMARRTTLPAVSKTCKLCQLEKLPKNPLIKHSWTQCFYLLFPAEQVGGATASSQPADSTSAPSTAERRETEDSEVGPDGEPSAAELRRRRLRKLETASTSSSSPPPPDN